MNDSVERSFLWKELARHCVPAKLVSILRQFHDGMRVCVHLDSGVTSEWLEVHQGLRLGCMMTPFLSSSFFAAVMTMTCDRFSIDKAVVHDFIRTAEKGGRTKARCGGPRYTPTMPGIASRSQIRLEKIMIIVVCATFAFVVVGKKMVTVYMRFRSMEADVVDVEAAGQRCKQVESFVYLGGTISISDDTTPEVNRRSE